MSLILPLAALALASAFSTPISTMKAGLSGNSSPVHPSQSDPTATPSSVVHAVLFFSTGCGHCVQVLTVTLPEMNSRYGDRLQLTFVSLEDQPAFDRLYGAAVELGLAKEKVAIPFMIIGRAVLIGSQHISDEMPRLIEAGLAAGGVPFPALNSLEGLVPGEPYQPLITPVAPATSQVLQPPDPSSPAQMNGYGLAWGVMALLVIAVLFAVYAFVGGPLPEWPTLRTGRAWALPALAVVGLLIAGYMSYVEIAHVNAFCGPIGDCNTVQTSRYAKIFGLIPMALFGLTGYLAILVGWAWPRWRSDSLARIAPLLVFAAALFGVLFSIYLTYVEIFLLRAVCAWCLGNAVVMALMLAAATPGALNALEPADAEDDAP